ncbi:hypothetical protein CA51_13470 [Rosistilla oblonga]|uniref:ATP-binding protein n=1 Tax=Rosistilla oblonga TaxID=2527990 RepID=UPI001187D25C|nr:ATP-binding protein [Rosistilla oblonga]QDV11483.1 hypothetical protein CA51_13470 [Rosistilla oblonga]
MTDFDYEKLFAGMSEGPAVLLMGQDLLRQYGSEDYFLSTCQARFGLESANSYDDLIANCGEAKSLMPIWHDISSRIAVPDDLEKLTSLPWNCVLTSSIHDVLDRALAADWRSVTPVLDDTTFPSDPRNRVKLSLYKLFGCVTRDESREQPPTDEMEQLERDGVAATMLRQLPTLVTPRGTLFIDGLDEADWLDTKVLAEAIAKLGSGQTHLFGATERTGKVREINLLQRMNKITLHSMTLGQAADSLPKDQIHGLIKTSRSWVEGVEFTFPNQKRHVFKASEWRRLTNGVTLLTDADAKTKYNFASTDEKYRRFRDFLYGSHGVPDWQAHVTGLAFRRQEFDDLKETVFEALEAQRLNEEPVLVTGQSGSGKSVALADLAISARSRGWPVLYFGRNQTDIDAGLVERISAELDRLESTSVLLVWDASQMGEQYSSLAAYLASRGRKVLVVGSSYEEFSGATCIPFPIMMSGSDAKRFREHLKSFDSSIVEDISAGDLENPNFWAWLWRLLPESRGRLRLGLLAEVETYNSSLEASLQAQSIAVPVATGTLGSILAEAGVQNEQTDATEELEFRTATGVAAEQVQKLNGLILIPSFFGQDVPVDLVLRCLGKEGFDVLRQALNETPVYRWTEDEYGNHALGARQQLEAQTVVRTQFRPAEQFDVLKTLLKSVRATGDWQTYNFEVDFALRLLNAIGPSSTLRTSTDNDLLDLADVIAEILASSGTRANPRLAFQEGYFRREALLRKLNNVEWDDLEKLDSAAKGLIQDYEKAAAALNQAEDSYSEASDKRYRRPLSRVHNEYASLCVLAQQILSEIATRASDSPIEARVRGAIGSGFDEAVRHCTQAAIFDSENYYSLDVRFKATKNELDGGRLVGRQSSGKRVELISDLCDVLDHESWRSSKEQYNKRRIELSHILGDPSIKEEALEELAKLGSTAGEYMLARNLIFDSQRNWRSDGDIERGLERIEAAEEKLDLRLARLYTNAWWQRFGKLDLYESERRSVPLSKSQWEHFAYWLNRRITFADEESLKARFFYAWALFQTGQYRESEDQFRILDRSTMAGRYRVVRLCVWGNERGEPIPCQGTIRRVSEDTDKGWVYVPALRREIIFRPTEFQSQTMLSNRPLEDFCIAFNFRGTIADPIRLVTAARKA